MVAQADLSNEIKKSKDENTALRKKISKEKMMKKRVEQKLEDLKEEMIAHRLKCSKHGLIELLVV